MDTTLIFCRLGKLLATLEATRLAAGVADKSYVISRCDSELRVAERALARAARSMGGDGTVAAVTDSEIEQIERSAARLADRSAWKFMTDVGELDSLFAS